VKLPRMKYWEIIADKLHKAGWNLGWVSALDREGRTNLHGDDSLCLSIGLRLSVHSHRLQPSSKAFVTLESR
jgi:hypothetical protein